MELLLDRKKSEYLHRTGCGNAIHEESTEIIVSDRSPDIERIVRGAGDAFITSREARDGKVCVGGNVRGVVLYIAEGEKSVRKLEVTMPFFHTFDADGVTPESKLNVKAYLRSFDVREINPRKVSVRASVDISFRAFEISEKNLYDGVSDGETYGICLKKRTIYGYFPIIMKEKSFSVSDDIELSGEGALMSSILFGNVRLLPRETKIIGNKSILKGIAEISYVYETEGGAVCSDECELPFSQILDIEGMDEGHELEVELSVTGFEFDPQYDAAGKARYMTVSITSDAVATVYEKCENEIIEDAYSTMFETTVKRDSLTSVKYIKREEKRVPTTESVRTGGGVKRVLDATVSVFPPVRRREDGREFISSDASVTVMYVGEDDLIYSASRRVPVVCPEELLMSHTYDVSSYVRGSGYSVGANDEINVRFFTDFAITETEEESVAAIIAIGADTDSARGGVGRPGISVIRIPRECDVWSLAKAHGVTVDEICAANEIQATERLFAGKMVLIPAHR